MNTDSLVTDLQALVLPWAIRAVGAAITLLVGWIAARIAARVTRRALSRVDTTVTGFAAHGVYFAVVAFAVVAALARFGVQTTSFVAILGAAGFAVGMALQGSLSNFASGVLLLVFRPFRVGEFIDAGGILGTVRQIGVFSTEVATPDNVKVVVPNSRIYGDVIRNFSVYDTRRIDVTVGIGYGDDIGRAIEVALGVMRDDDRILADPEPAVFVTELADSSVNLLLRCWSARTDFWNVRCDLTRRIKEAFDAAGIEIPYPQRVVHTVAAPSGPDKR